MDVRSYSMPKVDPKACAKISTMQGDIYLAPADALPPSAMSAGEFAALFPNMGSQPGVGDEFVPRVVPPMVVGRVEPTFSPVPSPSLGPVVVDIPIQGLIDAARKQAQVSTTITDDLVMVMRAQEALDGRISLALAVTALKRLARYYLDRVRPKLKMAPTIQLASGRYFDFSDPDRWPLQIDDIAHGLSKTCRFTGHIQDEDAIYSVAQHCVLASMYCEPGYEFEALMHDASESVLGDKASPLKQLLPDYRDIEDRVMASIRRHHGLAEQEPAAVKAIDMAMLATEKRDLLPGSLDEPEWRALPAPLPITIEPWTPRYAKNAFLARWAELTDKHNAQA